MAVQVDNNYQISAVVPKGIFRAYDIRGLVENELTPGVAYAVGRAISAQAVKCGVKKIAVGQDARPSSPGLAAALIAGITDSGVDVVSIGVVPTPVLYFATHHLDTNSGVMITGSHNPSEYNGIKMVLDGRTLSDGGIDQLYTCIQKQAFVDAQEKGKVSERPITEDYLRCILNRVKLKRPLKIVIDCGNGVGALTAPTLFRKLGCEVTELFCEVDGTFPNHHPDPTVPENLVTLQQVVKQKQADIGLAFDGDADRLGVVTDKGEIIWPDRQMMLLAKDVLSRRPGAKIVFDIKSTSGLAKEIEKAGGVPIMWKTGHSILKAKMIEVGAPLAGEMSGHIFFKEGWFGFDDGVFSGAKLLEVLAKNDKKVSEIFAALPNSVNTPELKLMLSEDRKHAFVEELKAKVNIANTKKIIIDGLRLDFGWGWALVRASNTTPCLTIRFEAETAEQLASIKRQVGEAILALDPSLKLPF